MALVETLTAHVRGWFKFRSRNISTKIPQQDPSLSLGPLRPPQLRRISVGFSRVELIYPRVGPVESRILLGFPLVIATKMVGFY